MNSLKVYCKNCGKSPVDCLCHQRIDKPVINEGRKDDSSKPKHSHYHKDVSQYDTMDIYAICKVWNVESSGCTFAAVKKLLNAGERGVKDRITDLEQAIESIEALIKLVKMDVDQ